MSLFQMSLGGGVLILFIVVVRALAIHRLPKTTFLVLWLIAALRLLLPFSIPLPFNIHIGLDIFSDVVQELPSGNIASTLPWDSPPSYDIGTAVPSPVTERISIFVMLWLVGALLLVLYFSISYLRSMRKFRMSIPDNTPYIQNWLTAHQISRPLAVRSSDLIFSPLTYGILHPVILLPKKLDRNDQVALKYVLTHEYVHIRRFDAITKILFAAVLCIHWFNPLVWVMYVLANRDMELSCDAWVICMMGEKNRSSYALMLIKMEEKRSGMSGLCSHFSKSAILERVEAIMKYKKAPIVVIVAALVIVVMATTVLAVNGNSTDEKIILSNGSATCPAMPLSNENEDLPPYTFSKGSLSNYADILNFVYDDSIHYYTYNGKVVTAFFDDNVWKDTPYSFFSYRTDPSCAEDVIYLKTVRDPNTNEITGVEEMTKDEAMYLVSNFDSIYD